MLMAIFQVYSTSAITFGKKVCRELKMAIFKIWNIRRSFNYYYVEQQGSWQAVLWDAPKILAILDHFYHPELLLNSPEVRS